MTLTQEKAKAGVIVAGGAVAVGLAVVAVWMLRDGLGQLLKGVNQIAEDATQTATAATGAVAGSVGATTSWLPNRDPDKQQGASLVAPKPSEFSASNRNLRLRVFDVKNTSPGALKKTRASFEVIDTATGKGVPHATLTGVANFAPSRRALGTIRRVCDYAGRYTGLEWTVGNVPGVDSEDDITFVARAPGYNPSPEVTVK